MALQIGDIMLVTFRGKIFDQRMLTILHYRVIQGTASGNVFADTQAWADWFANLTAAGELVTVYLATCAPEYSLEEIRVQRISPARNPYAISVVNLVGTNANAARTSNLAASITKRGVVAGRWANGRVQMPGLPADNVVDGEIAIGAQIDYQTLATKLAADQNYVGITQQLRPVIYNPGRVPNYTEIATWTVQTSARTMHRRTLRLGE